MKIEVKYINAYAETTEFYDENESADKNLYNFSPFFTLIKNGQKNSFEFSSQKKLHFFYRMIHFNAKRLFCLNFRPKNLVFCVPPNSTTDNEKLR